MKECRAAGKRLLREGEEGRERERDREREGRVEKRGKGNEGGGERDMKRGTEGEDV